MWYSTNDQTLLIYLRKHQVEIDRGRMARITYLLVMTLVVSVAAETSSFDCDGSLRKQASAMCRPFITKPQLGDPPSECCMAYRTLVKSARTTSERRQLCSCVQRRAQLPDVSVNIANLDALQEKCGLPFIYSGYRSFDCNT
ncbi:hypothetical protein DCAR_0310901 [Daucus carota subsp. sativus]|uniref:Bifunctional inhibitor/plant lipid transfer protein/seed storage helical domain-containing protein n=1 Tax=Daucus carota subsp. sativus TaxID=79200 RepID=A0AAF1ATB2_DAUCS|nr:hypothetical protein DCAR_0310901 [Daucus carota subsp. sativus]